MFLDDVSLAEITEDVVQVNQVIITHLTVTPTQYYTEDITITEGENYMGWTEAGIYERTLESDAGCNTIVTTNLFVILLSETSENDTLKDGKTDVTTSASNGQTIEVNDFILYPNPARSYINISYTLQPEDTKIEILDVNGRTIYNQKAESVLNRINTNQLPSGLYYLRSVQGQKQKVKKFIIE